MSAYTKPQQLDVRKFIRLINSGFNTQLNEAAGCVRKAGKKVNRDWKLVALNGTELLFEDATSDQYILAKYTSKPTPKLSNITPIEIVDEGKQDEFADACKLLVEAVESEDKKAVNSAFNRMSLHRFSSRIIPESKRVRCKDGSIYELPVNENATFNAVEIGQILKEAKTHYSSGVVIQEGKIVAYNGSGNKLRIDPLLPYAVRARSLRQVAIDGHANQQFRRAVLESASLLAEGKNEESAKTIGRALQKDEEFTLLSEGQMIGVVANCLATEAIFNDKLASDLGVMAHQLNLKLNRGTIVREWRKTAKKAGSTVLLENVHRLENASNFDSALSKFLYILFEDSGGRDTKILMLRTTLEKMSNDIPGIAKDPNLNEKMQSLIGRLKNDQVDEATLFEAEDVVAAVGDELQDTETLDDFDAIGGGGDEEFDLSNMDDEAADATGDSMVQDDGKGGTTITINSPLIQIGGDSGTPDDGAEADLDGAMGNDLDVDPDALDVDLADTDEADGMGDLGGEEGQQTDPLAVGGVDDEDTFDFDLDGTDEEDEDENAQPSPFGESVQSPVHYEMKSGSEDDMPPTSFPKRGFKISESVNTYGQKLLQQGGLIDDVLSTMHSLVLAGQDNIQEAAGSALKVLKISYPKASQWQVVQEAVAAYESADMEAVAEDADDPNYQLQSGRNPVHARIVNLGEEADEESDDEEKVEEEQLRGPNTNPLGINNSDNKDPVVEWSNVGNGVSHGICENTKFILGHSALDKMELRSIDGSVTVPVPTPLCESALGSLNLADTSAKPFHKWVGQIVESIQPLTELEDDDLDDAIDQTDDDDDMLSVYSAPGDEDDYGMDDMYELKMVHTETGEEVNVAARPDGTLVPTGEETSGDDEDADDNFEGSDDDRSDDDGDDEGSEDDEDSDGGDDGSGSDSGSPVPPQFKKDSDDSDDGDDDSEDGDDDDSDDEEESGEDEEDDAGEEEDSEESDDSDDKPAFLKESKDKDGNGRPDFIDKKIADKKGKKDEPIEEGPYDYTQESYDAELGLYWYQNAWYVGDGPVQSMVDQPAPAVIQQLAAKLGITNQVAKGQIDSDQLIFAIGLDIDYEGESFRGDMSGPIDQAEAPFDDRSARITGAKVKLDLPDGTKKEIPLGQDVVRALAAEMDDDLGSWAAERQY